MKKLFTATLLLFSLLTYTQAAENEKPLAEMTMTDITGKTYDVTEQEKGLNIKGLEGKVIFLEFFGHNCPPCIRSIPHLINLQKKHKDKLAIVAIEVQGYNNEQVKKFAKEKGINYITVSQEKASKLVNYIQYQTQWEGSIPYVVAFDTKGDFILAHVGPLSDAQAEEIILKNTK